MRLSRFALLALLAVVCMQCNAYDRGRYNALVDGQFDGTTDANADARSDIASDAPRDVVQTDALDALPDGGCSPACSGMQVCCGGMCVDTRTNPENCGSCGAMCSGTTCSGGSCTSICRLGFLDCDGNVVNGCEANASSDNNNCGSCGRVCPTGRTCQSGNCACADGAADCDGNPANGCEIATDSDPLNCGACNHACGPGQSCVTGTCTCDGQRGDCDGNMANGCETDLTADPSHCGACATACGANSTCTAGTCACNTGFLRCPATAAGCTTPLNDPNNCGMCGTVCSGATPFCGTMGCTLSCPTGLRPCGNACADLTTDVANCGACGTVCPSAANSIATCNAGMCDSRCVMGFGDCDGNTANGCETDLRSSGSNCGVCGTACAGSQICSGGACTCPAGQRDCGSGRCAACCSDTDCSDGNSCTTDSCTSGTCQHVGCAGGTVCCGGLACQSCCSNADCSSVPGNYGCSGSGTCTVCLPGFSDCDANTANGCETPTGSDVNNCGTCGMACSFPNAAPMCAGGTCAIGACLPGFANCDGNAANGCEVNLNSDAANCGRCGGTCVAPTNTCSGGTCMAPVCPAGRGDCDGNGSNGCETDITTSLTNCGACGTSCNYANASGTCSSGTCMLAACNTGYGNCDGSSSNGCETNLNTTVSRCGSCTTACSYANASAVCASGSCAFGSCNSGFANCDGTTSNGCETATGSDPTHCGSCTNVCTTGANATATCSGGLCGLSCTTGFADCDRIASTGCEVNTRTDATNCGSCGRACATGEVCTSGVCLLPASSFQITNLSTTGCATQEHSAYTGSDRAGIVTSNSRVFYDGTYGTGVWDLPSFANPTTASQYDALVGDLHTGRVFALGTRMAGPIDITGGRVNALLEIDPSTGALNGTQINLSTQINLTATTGFFSGWDRLVVHNGSHVYSISLSGTVTDLGAMATPVHQACVGWGYWGVAEYFGATLYLTYVQNSTTIVRARVPDGMLTTVGTFSNLGNTCAITFSPTRSRWYFHYSGSAQFATGSQILGYCPGSWSAPDTGCPAGSINCSGTCHFVNTDDANCASCGTPCSGGLVCVGGSCGTACAVGQTVCGGACRNLNTDINNCGTCGNVCPTGANGYASCSAGSCSFFCNYGYGNCNGTSSDGCEVSTLSNNTNCGSCGNVCGTGSSCCSGSCRDVTTDPVNCGGCGVSCVAPMSCSSSVCGCPLTCGGICVEPLTDANNCGGCGITCGGGNVCVNGSCRSPFTGYTESTSPLAFVNACAQAVHSEYLPNLDDSYASAQLPFGFLFYGSSYRNFFFSTNGTLGFGSPTAVYSNTCLPTTSITNAILAYWDDLYTRTRICTATIGSAPSRQHVVTWDDVRLFSDSTAHLTFSVVLTEGSNAIDLLYQTVSPAGASATVGVQDSTGTVSTQHSCNTATVTAGTAIRFTGM